MTPLEARLLLKSQVRDKKLLKHSFVMESIMLKLAKKLGENEDEWGLVGLLHDLDAPQTLENPEKHGHIAGEILQSEGCSESVISAVKAHSGNSQRKSRMDIAIYSAEALIEIIENEGITEKDYESGLHFNSPMIDKVNECNKLGWTVEEFSGIIYEVLLEENYWR